MDTPDLAILLTNIDSTYPDSPQDPSVKDHQKQHDLIHTVVRLIAPVANVKSYGAVGSGLVSDLVAIQAAVTALPAGGGTVFFPPGIYLVGSGSISDQGKCVTFAGSSRSSVKLLSNTGTGTVFIITGTGTEISSLTIENNTAWASVTSGAGIRQDGGNFNSYRDLTVVGFYEGLVFTGGYGFAITRCYVVNNKRYGVYVRNISDPDAGDSQITNCTFDCGGLYAAAAAAIRQESSGGLKITANKVVHHDRGFDLMVAEGVETSVLTITGNSFEGQNVAAIRMGRLGSTGTFGKITVGPNQINGTAAGGTMIEGIVLGAGIYQALIVGNMMEGITTATAIKLLSGVDNVAIATNSMNGFAVGIDRQLGSGDIQVSPQKFRGVLTPLKHAQNLPGGPQSVLDQQYVNDLGTITSDSVPTQYFRVVVPDYTGVFIKATVTGIVQGVGGFVKVEKRTVIQGAGGAAPTVAALTADTAGPAVVVDFDVTSVAGSLIVGVRRSAGIGTAINGRIHIQIDGTVNSVYQYAVA